MKENGVRQQLSCRNFNYLVYLFVHVEIKIPSSTTVYERKRCEATVIMSQF